MAMPPQLQRSDRRRKSEPRAIVELTPHIDIHDLRHIIPRDYSTYIYSNSFKYPFAQKFILSRINIEVFLHLGYTQTVALHWIRTGFGRPRPILVCSQCHCGARRLFLRYGHLACRYCHKLSYASRQLDSITRKRLAAAKLRLNLGGLPDINEAIAPKAKRKHRRSYNKARKHIDRLEAPIKAYRFRKPLSTQLFAYHVS
jgi:hypothetical protein